MRKEDKMGLKGWSQGLGLWTKRDSFSFISYLRFCEEEEEGLVGEGVSEIEGRRRRERVEGEGLKGIA